MEEQKAKGSWKECVVDTDYEIFSEYPYDIRRKSNKRIVSESKNKGGYIVLNLNNYTWYKHHIVAIQFIPNDNPLINTDIDHKNKDRSDYHIENLRWVSPSENQKNKTSHKGVEYDWLEDDDIPDDLIVVEDYGNHEFEDYYYSPSMDRFMFDNGIKTRLLHINYKSNGSAYVNMMNKNNVKIKVYYSKFKRLYDLI